MIWLQWKRWLCLSLIPGFALAEAPYGGTVYTVANILTEQDPSTLSALTYVELVESEEYDHRAVDWVDTEFYRYLASYPEGQEVEVLVNAEFDTRAQARFAAQTYAFVLGQMPRLLRMGVERMVIHETGEDWSASPGEITIHDGAVEAERADGALEESMIHETVHTTLDPLWEDTRAWRRAQQADGGFISEYGQDNPNTEDLAESFTLYLGLALHPERMPADVVMTMLDVMPERLDFFAQNFPPDRLGL